MNLTALFFISAAIAVLSGMGVGGGGLFVIFLRFLGMSSQVQNQALNLIFFLFASCSALLIHLPRRKIYPLAVAVMAVFGILGSLGGVAVASRLDGGILRVLFAVMLMIAGFFSFIRSFLPPKKDNKKNNPEQ